MRALRAVETRSLGRGRGIDGLWRGEGRAKMELRKFLGEKLSLEVLFNFGFHRSGGI